MKKGFMLFLMLLFLFLCFWGGSKSENIYISRKPIGKKVVYYSDSDSSRNDGCYKEEIWEYEYPYYKSYMHLSRINDSLGVEVCTNEFGDTVEKTYINYKNYPRREED